MPFDIQLSKDLTLDIRKCPHLLIIGKGDNWAEFSKDIEKSLSSVDKANSSETFVYVLRCLNGITKRDKEVLDERYELLSALDCCNIEQFNKRFKHESLMYEVLFVSPAKTKYNDDLLKEVLMKGRAVGIHVVMFADSMDDFEKNIDLLDMFTVKLVYKVKTEKESINLTGYKGAEKLKGDEFMLCELGKQPVIYKAN